MARRATAIKEKRESESLFLVVDNGNFARGKDLPSELKARYLAKAMYLMGYDAINLGQEEVILGSDPILDIRDRERVPLLSSNLFRQESDRPLVTSYLIKRLGTSRFLGFEYGGVKVAIVGLVGEGLPNPKGQEVSRDLILADPEETLQAIVKKLRKHCDLVCVLSDLELRKAQALAQKVSGIDLFFVEKGARAKHVERMDETIFIRPASRGKELGDIELVLNDKNQITSHQVQWTLLDKNVENDEEVGQLVSDYKVALKELKVPQQGCK